MYIKTSHLQNSERLGNLAMVDRMFDVEIGKEPFPNTNQSITRQKKCNKQRKQWEQFKQRKDCCVDI